MAPCSRRHFLTATAAVTLCGFSMSVHAEEWFGELVALQPKRGQDHAPVITAVAIHPSGQILALGGDDHLVRLWDLRGRKISRVLEGHTDWVKTLKFSPNGEMLVTSGNDHQVFVWNMQTGEKLREYSRLSHVVTSVEFSHDGRLVAVVGFGDKLRIIDGTTGDLLREYGCPCSDMRAVRFSPSDDIIVGGGRNGKVRLWNSADGEPLGEFTAHSQRIRDVAISADGLYLATCGEDRKIVITRTLGDLEFELPRQGAKVMCLTFCGPNQLATGGSDNMVRIWDLTTREQIATLEGHTGTVAVLTYHQNILVSSSFDASVRVWNRSETVVEGADKPSPRVGLRRSDLNTR